MNARTAITRIVLAACFLTPLCWIFAEAIFTSRLFVFRDAGHYYYPLFRWTASEWGEKRIPLWNPYENSGTPAVADPTASVFYPGKLLFALPLDFPARYKLYILSHVILAGGAAWFTARSWNASPAAATVCGMSYAFGGSVVFQYCNVVYLVGAAWLPLALWSADKLLRRRRWIWALLLGVVLAMMVLGGDPQTAYHAGLVALLGVWLHWRRSPALPSPAPRRRFSARHPALLLVGAAGIAVLLAAVQIVPAAEWTRRSERAAFDEPRSLYELPAWLSRASANRERTTSAGFTSLVGSPAAGTHHDHIYQFSVGPWRWAEFIWPNFSGRVFPIHRRWIQAIPAEGRPWTPSLYLGLAPIIAALAAWRIRGGSLRTRWLSWTVLLALAAALGWYGLGWMWMELRYALGGDPAESNLGAPTGGLYWLLVNILPGYVYFRYPAKWLTIASLAISLLAARGWDAAFVGRSLRARRLLILAGVLSLAGIAASIAVRPYWSEWMAAAGPDDFFGPFDASGAARDLLLALVQTAVLCSLLLFAQGKLRAAATWAAFLTAIDLCLAHGWMAPTAPAEFWERTPEAAAMIREDAARRGLSGFRIFRASQARWLPREWMEASSIHRQAEGVAWDHGSLYPKHHLLAALPLVESRGSILAADYAALLDVARREGVRRPDGIREPAPEVLRLLGADYALLPRGAHLPGGALLSSSVGEGDLSNVAVWRSPALPRAWIVENITSLPELDDNSHSSLVRRTRKVLFENGRWRDFHRVAVVETSADAPPVTTPPSPASAAAGQCRIIADEPLRTEIEVDLARPGLLVLAVLYDASWRASYTPQGETEAQAADILRTNRVQRGVWLPPGRGRVTFVYAPRSFYLGAALSLLTWLFLLIWVGWIKVGFEKVGRLAEILR